MNYFMADRNSQCNFPSPCRCLPLVLPTPPPYPIKRRSNLVDLVPLEVGSCAGSGPGRQSIFHSPCKPPCKPVPQQTPQTRRTRTYFRVDRVVPFAARIGAYLCFSRPPLRSFVDGRSVSTCADDTCSPARAMLACCFQGEGVQKAVSAGRSAIPTLPGNQPPNPTRRLGLGP